MSHQLKTTIIHLAALANVFGVVMLALIAATAAIFTALAVAGIVPWLEIQASLGGTVYDNAGQIAQIGFTVLLLLLTVYLPSAHRVMRLETSHRRFEVGMQDVARAYATAHASDRAGLFNMSSEYDAVRERIVHLRNHPDLQELEPAVLEVAAQMSQVSKELAETYSDENVERAQSFLRARQNEVEDLNDRIDRAKQITTELQNWKNAVDADETVAASQIARLHDALADILPELTSPDVPDGKARVVSLPRYAAE